MPYPAGSPCRGDAMPEILVLYYSRGGSVARLARQIARGIASVDGMQARLRTVPPVAPVTEVAAPPVARWTAHRR